VATSTYSLNADFRRMARQPLAVYETAMFRGLIAIGSLSEWTHLKAHGASNAQRFYYVAGYPGAHTIEVYPLTDNNVTVHYASSNWMATAGGTAGSTFSDETDVLLMPNRMVEAGIVWRWRERKGLPYEDKWNEYEAMLARYSNDAFQRTTINMGDQRAVRWQDMIPAFIPSS
jgi:hypothetical protein